MHEGFRVLSSADTVGYETTQKTYSSYASIDKASSATTPTLLREYGDCTFVKKFPVHWERVV